MGKVLEKLGFEVVVMTAQQSVPERVPVTAQDILDQVERRLKDKPPTPYGTAFIAELWRAESVLRESTRSPPISKNRTPDPL
ncbi:MAG: hypothetical protein ACKV2Q_11815 [Planctomycetaceae bacterium]